jgi:hypothetical protein
MARMTKARISNSLAIDYQVGRPLITCAGLFRPVVGAILGLAVYILINADLLPLKVPTGFQSHFFYAAVAFLAGFSERLAQDALFRTSCTVFMAEKESEKP